VKKDFFLGRSWKKMIYTWMCFDGWVSGRKFTILLPFVQKNEKKIEIMRRRKLMEWNVDDVSASEYVFFINVCFYGRMFMDHCLTCVDYWFIWVYWWIGCLKPCAAYDFGVD
jgi:hypothetical protein